MATKRRKPAGRRRVRNGRVEVFVRSHKRRRPEKAWQKANRSAREWGF
jgi:hypothetical protein